VRGAAVNARLPQPAPRLVVNGDDGGLHPATDQALLEAGQSGILTSLSVVVQGDHAPKLVAGARAAGLGIGLHFNLSQGRPLARDLPSLTTPQGLFLGPKRILWQESIWSHFQPEEVAREALAQWQRLEELGATPDHLDGHNHVHLLPPVMAGLRLALRERVPLFLRLPEEPECPPELLPALPAGRLRATEIRRQLPPSWRAADRFAGFLFTHQPTRAGIAHLFPPRPGLTEWMVHPGSRPGSPFTEDGRREQETRALCDPKLRGELLGAGYTLARFADCS